MGEAGEARGSPTEFLMALVGTDRRAVRILKKGGFGETALPWLWQNVLSSGVGLGKQIIRQSQPDGR